ncbi:phage tail protein [Limnohabitans sp. WS1]|uniref:phage tail protein n=1 Tax=Limnohabitans sp. WS1 TaxID=1100726 RepID=UPI000D3950BB|nr:phage tail protein [Limnohabitans sp. WS1]PUE20342.1 oxidoreductase [Limnohabitans sp. WS1]
MSQPYLMALGQFVFSLNTLAFEELDRNSTWRHPSNSRVGASPALQFVGPGDDSINLKGLLAPEFMGDPASFDTLRKMGNSGKAYALVNGAGRVYEGAWVIESLQQTGSVLSGDGVPRRIEFTLALKRTDNLLADPTGGPTPINPDNGDDEWAGWWWE